MNWGYEHDGIILPTITSEVVESLKAELSLKIDACLPYFDGHFPEARVLPGVVQLGWAMRLGQQLFDCDYAYHAIEALKFQHVIFPDTEVKITLEYNPAKNKLMFKIFDDLKSYSSGRIEFIAHE